MSELRRFEGRVALVTGAAAGIGRATAERLAAEGAQLWCVDVEQEGLESLAKSLAAADPQTGLETGHCDVSDLDSVAAAVAGCVERFGRIDALCHVAGIQNYGHTHEFPLDEWNRILSVNLTGTFLMCRAALPHLLETRGNVVNTSSTTALAGMAYGAAYGASKAGILAFTRTLAIEYGRQGLRANAVCPGSIVTAMFKTAPIPKDADWKLIQRGMALDQPRGPETVASLIAFLASDDAAHINGEEIRVDGATLS